MNEIGSQQTEIFGGNDPKDNALFKTDTFYVMYQTNLPEIAKLIIIEI